MTDVPSQSNPTFPAGLDSREPWTTYAIAFQSPPAAPELKLTSEADIEFYLRSILAELAVIPLAANAMLPGHGGNLESSSSPF
jgi:hypothetical protein